MTAAAAGTLQEETAGRASLGFAQGDSALTQLGRARLPVAAFERTLAALQAFLRGEAVQLPDGTASAIRWLRDSALPKVPVHVAATGPRTIQAAARHAEGVDLTLGADPARLRHGVATAREAGPPDLMIGAYVNVAVDPVRRRARDLVRGSVATFARFSSGADTAGGLSDVTGHGVARAVAGYRTDHHGEAGARVARQLDDAFIDRFAVTGPPSEVRDRLDQMIACGVQRLIIVPGSLDTDPEATLRSTERLARDVLPHLTA